MLGGFCVGSIGNLLGREGVSLLSGVSVLGVTGPYEGLVLGAAVGLIGKVVFTAWGQRSIIAAALLGGAGAGILIQLSNGTLLAGSLWQLQRALPATQLAMQRVGRLIGEAGFTSTTKVASVIVEAQIFVLSMTAALLICAIGVEGSDKER